MCSNKGGGTGGGKTNITMTTNSGSKWDYPTITKQLDGFQQKLNSARSATTRTRIANALERTIKTIDTELRYSDPNTNDHGTLRGQRRRARMMFKQAITGER